MFFLKTLFLSFVISLFALCETDLIQIKGKNYQLDEDNDKITLFQSGSRESEQFKDFVKMKCARALNTAGWATVFAAALTSPLTLGYLFESSILGQVLSLFVGTASTAVLVRDKWRIPLISLIQDTYSWFLGERNYSISLENASRYMKINHYGNLVVKKSGMDQIIRKFISKQKGIITSEKVFLTGMNFDYHMNIDDFLDKEILLKEYKVNTEVDNSGGILKNLRSYHRIYFPHKKGSAL